MNNLKKIKQISSIVRDACDYSVSRGMLPVKFPLDLTGLCAIASNHLYLQFKKHNIKSKFVKGYYKNNSHCWVEVDDKIIDITATQFNVKQKIFITNKNNKKYIKESVGLTALSGVKLWGYQNPNNYKLIYGNNYNFFLHKDYLT